MQQLAPHDALPRTPPPRSIAIHRRRIIRLLIAHDQVSEVDAWLQELKRVEFAVSAKIVRTPEEFAEQLRTQRFDVVLAANSMPNWTGAQMLALLREQDADVPFILMGSELEEKVVDEFIREGASDCVDRNRLARLPLAIGIAVEKSSMRAETNRVELKLRHSEAHYHALAGNPTYGIFRIGLDGEFLEVNEALAKMLGYASGPELMAASLAGDIIRDPIERSLLLQPFRETGHINSLELEWRRKDGTPMKVRLSGLGVDSGADAPEVYEIIAEDVTSQRASEEHFRHLAVTDALTGLANYRRLTEALESELNRSERSGRSFGILLCDLDGMKQINDRHGHLTGNRALCRLAHVLRFSCRSIDTAARYGGDEFAIVLPETGTIEAGLVKKRICESLREDRGEPTLSVSIGVAVYPRDGKTIENLLQIADRALYKTKHP